nr:hypothetical protein [Mitsuokella multacida]
MKQEIVHEFLEMHEKDPFLLRPGRHPMRKCLSVPMRSRRYSTPCKQNPLFIEKASSKNLLDAFFDVKMEMLLETAGGSSQKGRNLSTGEVIALDQATMQLLLILLILIMVKK